MYIVLDFEDVYQNIFGIWFRFAVYIFDKKSDSKKKLQEKTNINIFYYFGN